MNQGEVDKQWQNQAIEWIIKDLKRKNAQVTEVNSVTFPHIKGHIIPHLFVTDANENKYFLYVKHTYPTEDALVSLREEVYEDMLQVQTNEQIPVVVAICLNHKPNDFKAFARLRLFGIEPKTFGVITLNKFKSVSFKKPERKYSGNNSDWKKNSDHLYINIASLPGVIKASNPIPTSIVDVPNTPQNIAHRAEFETRNETMKNEEIIVNRHNPKVVDFARFVLRKLKGEQNLDKQFKQSATFTAYLQKFLDATLDTKVTQDHRNIACIAKFYYANKTLSVEDIQKKFATVYQNKSYGSGDWVLELYVHSLNMFKIFKDIEQKNDFEFTGKAFVNYKEPIKVEQTSKTSNDDFKILEDTKTVNVNDALVDQLKNDLTMTKQQLVTVNTKLIDTEQELERYKAKVAVLKEVLANK